MEPIKLGQGLVLYGPDAERAYPQIVLDAHSPLGLDDVFAT